MIPIWRSVERGIWKDLEGGKGKEDMLWVYYNMKNRRRQKKVLFLFLNSQCLIKKKKNINKTQKASSNYLYDSGWRGIPCGLSWCLIRLYARCAEESKQKFVHRDIAKILQLYCFTSDGTSSKFLTPQGLC